MGKMRKWVLPILFFFVGVGYGSIFAGGVAEKSQVEEEGRPKLTILTNINVDTEGTDVNNNDYIHYVEDQTGLNIEFINEPTSSNYPQKLNTMMASNNIPDVVMLMDVTQRADLARFADEGMIVPLDNYLTDYPNLKGALKPESWELTKHNGKIYAVPFQRFDSTPYMAFMRKDWLDNLNINPDTDLETIDDWYNVLKRFVTDDPDRDGKNDTYGMTATTSGTHFTCEAFLDAFDAAKDKFVDGELQPYYILPQYKQWLKFMHKLYEEKILDPNFIVDDSSLFWNKVTSGKYGSFLWFWGLTEYQSTGYDRSDLVAVRPPRKRDGSESSYVYSSPNRHMMAITSACKHPENALKLFDWACSQAGGVFVYAGIEGKDYDMVNGKIVLRPDRKGKNIGWRQLTLGVQNPNVSKEPLHGIMVQNYGSQGMDDLALADKCGSYNNLDLYCPTFTELQKYDLLKPVQQFTDKAIIGAVDIDSEWDKYVANWRHAGGDEKIKLATEWYVNSGYANNNK